MSKGLSQDLADLEPEAQPERIHDHEEHPKPVDQDALSVRGHIASLLTNRRSTKERARPLRRDRNGAGHIMH